MHIDLRRQTVLENILDDLIAADGEDLGVGAALHGPNAELAAGELRYVFTQKSFDLLLDRCHSLYSTPPRP